MHKRTLYTILVILFLLALSIPFVLYYQVKPGWDFRNNLWAPAYRLVHHQSPYAIQSMFETSNAIWLPVILGAFLPVGFLPLEQANSLWILVNVLALAAILFLCVPKRHVRFGLVTAMLALSVLFLPTMSVLILGQVSLLICLIFALIMFIRKPLHPLLVGLLLALSLTKPQLAVFFIPTFLILQWKESGALKAFLQFGWLVLGVLLLTLPVFLLFPNWIPDFIENLKNNRIWLQPNLYSLVFAQLGKTGTFLGVLYFLIGLALCWRISQRSEAQTALIWSLIITPFFSPYIWSWDFVLFIPPLIYFYLRGSRTGKIIEGVGVIGTILAMIALKVLVSPSDEIFWWVPPALLLVVLGNVHATRKIVPEVAK